MSFEVVSEFKYLGMVFDGKGSEKKMVANMLVKARKTFHWLVSFLNQNGWQHPNLRLVLFDVYVRSILQYGCSVWAPKLILGEAEHSIILPLLAQ